MVPEPPGYFYDHDSGMKKQCGGHTAEGQHDGQIVSPGYPITYPFNVSCNWLIRVDRGKKIYIRILELELASSMGMLIFHRYLFFIQFSFICLFS